MKRWRCSCGEAVRFSTVEPVECSGCAACGSQLQEEPGPYPPAEPHQWSVAYLERDDAIARKVPIQRCLRPGCGETRRVHE